MFKKLAYFILTIGILFSYSNCAFSQVQKIRVGHFPNVTHAPVLAARANAHFEKEFKDVVIEWKTFNAGPEAVEALLAGELDLVYLGPNPAINGYVRSKGEALRILAGTANGGSAFVVHKDSTLNQFEDMAGKRASSPQKGNSQDVALLYLMAEKGLRSKTQGGDVELFNISGGDQITALARKQVDGIWTVEPWVSRLISEADGKILFEENELWPEGKYATTVLAGRKKFIDEHPELVQKWVSLHVRLIEWFNQNSTEAKQMFNQELKKQTGKALPENYLEQSFNRIHFTADPMEQQVHTSAERALKIGYLGKNNLDLTHLYELSFLNQAKKELND